MDKVTALGKALELAYKIIHGGNNKYGLLDCMDCYYRGVYDEDLEHLEQLIDKSGFQIQNQKPNE